MHRRPSLASFAIALAAALGGCGGGDAGPDRASGTAKPREVSAGGAIAPIGDRVLARIPTGAIDVCSIVPAGERMWISSTELRSLIVVDPRINRVVARVRLPGHACKLVATDDLLWAMLAREGLVVGLDPLTGRIVQRVRTEDTCHWGFTATDDALWLAEYVGGSVYYSRRDARTGATLARLRPTRGGEPCAVALAGDSLWFGTNDRAVRVDPELDGITALIDAGPEPFYTVLAFGNQVWYGNHGKGEMRRLDARTGRVAAVYRFGGGSLAADEDDLWATSSLDARWPEGRDPILVRLDRHDDRVIARYRIGRRAPPLTAAPDPYLRGSTGNVIVPLSGTTLTSGSLWVHSNAERRLYRINPER
jgi:hypothetical protein